MKKYKDTNYLVTEDGKIWSEKRKKFLSACDNGTGYMNVVISIDSKFKHKYVHRLVAEVYLENPNNYPHINHIDNNRYNNHVSNLEWSNYQLNSDHKVKQKRHPHGITNGQSKLTEEQVLEIRKVYVRGEISYKQLGKIYGVDASLIGYIINRKWWKHI
jgi:hypothetical protein